MTAAPSVNLFGLDALPRVLVLGAGESGAAIARWVVRQGGSVLVADSRSEGAPLAGFDTRRGPFTEDLLDGIALIGISPGLSPYHETVAPLLATAATRGIAVWSEIEFFARAIAQLIAQSVDDEPSAPPADQPLPGADDQLIDEDAAPVIAPPPKRALGYQPKLIGITGTNGKTTVTTLCAHLSKQAGWRTEAAGNISPAALDALSAALDRQLHGGEPLPQCWVLELSSFQLETTHSLKLDAAVVLNISEDHLDWHPSLAQYMQAKGRIYQHAAIRVFNRADPQTIALAGPGAISFGLDAPVEPGCFGIVNEGGLRWLAWAERDEAATATPKRRRAVAVEPPRIHRLMPADALHVIGEHNIANTLAALALTQAVGVPMRAALHGLRSFTGLPHRVEVLRKVRGVDYIDDSKGTNVGATVAALTGLRRRVVLIAGGEGKGQDFAPLRAPVAQWAQAVVLIGRDADLIEQALQGVVTVSRAPSLEAAVEVAAEIARRSREMNVVRTQVLNPVAGMVATTSAAGHSASGEPEAEDDALHIVELPAEAAPLFGRPAYQPAGEPIDAVLLSPACASFDMFRDYRHRAEVFAQAVRAYAIEQGEIC